MTDWIESKTTSWPVQRSAMDYAIRHKRCGLWMRMGLGKSKVICDLAHCTKRTRVLIVAPKAVLNVWPLQFDKHCATNYTLKVIDGRNSKKILESLTDMDVAVINYEKVPAAEDVLSSFVAGHDALMVCDESHRIKSHDSKASKACWRIGMRCDYRIAMTGTLIHNSPLDVYGQYRFIDDTIFGRTWTPFKMRYAVTAGPHNQWIVGTKNLDELDEIIKRRGFFASENDAMQLPDFTDTIVPVVPAPETLRIHNEIKNDMVAVLSNGDYVAIDNALGKVLRMQQVTGGELRVDGEVAMRSSEKESALGDILDGLSDEHVVVFYKFSSEALAIRAAAGKSGFKYFELSGAHKENVEFQESKHKAVIAVQIQCGGSGIDLTSARYCVYWSTGYSLGDYEQSRARLHRPGQKRNVSYMHLHMMGTIDENIYQLLHLKQDVATWLTTMRGMI